MAETLAAAFPEHVASLLDRLIANQFLPAGTEIGQLWLDDNWSAVESGLLQSKSEVVAVIPIDGGRLNVSIPVYVTVRETETGKAIVRVEPDLRRFKPYRFETAA